MFLDANFANFANYEGGKREGSGRVSKMKFKSITLLKQTITSPTLAVLYIQPFLNWTLMPLTPTLSPFGGERESDSKGTTTGCGFDLTIHRAAVKNFQMSCTLLTL
jgi:hypothetical protein